MMGLRFYGLIFALGALLTLGGAFWYLKNENAKLHSENNALRASVRSLKLESELSRTAQEVAEARAAGVIEKAKEYDALREGILRNGQDDDLVDWLRDVVIGVRAGSNGETGIPEDTE